VLVQNVRVVSVRGEQTKANQTAINGQQSVIPVTLALEPNDALAVTYASAFATEVRLVGLPTGTGENRAGEKGNFDAKDLGGQAVPEAGSDMPGIVVIGCADQSLAYELPISARGGRRRRGDRGRGDDHRAHRDGSPA